MSEVKVSNMFERVYGFRERLIQYVNDREGAATTEWLVAVSIVVMMAVPVLAVIGDGSEEASGDMVISIEDADSFGGGGFQPQDGDEMADLGDEPYNPGADMGVGFPDDGEEIDLAGNQGEDGQEGNKVPGTTVDRPRFYASVTGGTRRDKSQGGFGAAAALTGANSDAIIAAVVAEEVDLPSPRRTRRYRARNEVCEFDEIIEVDSGSSTMVVASGR